MLCIQHLYKARQSIDQAILSMKLNVTRSLAQDVTAIATGPLSVTIQELPNDSNQKRFIAQQSRMLNGRNASQAIANGNLITYPVKIVNILKSTILITLFICWLKF